MFVVSEFQLASQSSCGQRVCGLVGFTCRAFETIICMFLFNQSVVWSHLVCVWSLQVSQSSCGQFQVNHLCLFVFCVKSVSLV